MINIMANGVSTEIDNAGGLFIPSQSTVFVEGNAVIVNGDDVRAHGTSPHDNAKIIASGTTVFIGGIAVVQATDVATCAHLATGSATVFIG